MISGKKYTIDYKLDNQVFDVIWLGRIPIFKVKIWFPSSTDFIGGYSYFQAKVSRSETLA
jgi:hypothetical protein